MDGKIIFRPAQKFVLFFTHACAAHFFKTIYAPVNLTASCTMVFMRASPLQEVLGPGT